MNLFLKSVCILFFILPGFITAYAQQQPALPHSKNKTIIIAHRGNHVNVPENTLASTRAAIQCGADYVEADLRTTKDGHLVVMHDSKVDRTTNGSGKVADLTLAELKALQVFNKNKKTHRIPEFREMLALCKGKINIYLDFKEADVAATWKQIQAAGMENQVVIYLNKEEQYRQWKSTAPHLPLMTSLPGEVTDKESLHRFLKKFNVQVLDNVTTPALVSAAHELGLAVWLDVQNPSEGPASWQEALNKNIDGLQTDNPAGLVTFLKK